MLTKRIIACLDVHDGRVVKGVQFVDLIDAGDPATQAVRHAREGADEIVLLDITATHEGRKTLLETVRRTASELFVPFTVGGGIRSAGDAEQVFDAGADKVSINSAALADPAIDRRDRAQLWRAGGGGGDRCASRSRGRRSRARCPGVRERRARACGATRGGMGAGGGSARRGRDSAHINGFRRNSRRLRLRIDRGREHGCEHSRDRVRRCGNGAALCRSISARLR